MLEEYTISDVPISGGNATITKMANLHFEEAFADGSGVECSVCFEDCRQEGAPIITFYSCPNRASFPIDKLGWIKECLTRIEAEMAKENA